MNSNCSYVQARAYATLQHQVPATNREYRIILENNNSDYERLGNDVESDHTYVMLCLPANHGQETTALQPADQTAAAVHYGNRHSAGCDADIMHRLLSAQVNTAYRPLAFANHAFVADGHVEQRGLQQGDVHRNCRRNITDRFAGYTHNNCVCK